MYAGFYNLTTGAVYVQYIPNPVSMQAYSVVVPNSASQVYEPVAVIDQNNDGIVDPGDIENVSGNSYAFPILVTGTTANENITLPSGGATATVSTQHFQLVSSQGYYLQLRIFPADETAGGGHAGIEQQWRRRQCGWPDGHRLLQRGYKQLRPRVPDGVQSWHHQSHGGRYLLLQRDLQRRNDRDIDPHGDRRAEQLRHQSGARNRGQLEHHAHVYLERPGQRQQLLLCL
jgi:hypothetical protein